MRAKPADCLAPIVAFANKRRQAGGLTAGNGKGRQRSARQAKVGKNSQRSAKPPNGKFCPPMPAFASQCQPLPYPCKSPPACLLHPPKPALQKTKTLLLKESQALTAVWPIGHKLNMLSSFASWWIVVDWCERQRAPLLFTIVLRCLQMYLFRGITKMIVTQQVVAGVPALVKVHRLLPPRSLGTKSAGLSLPQAFCIACSSASCGGRVYCCNQLVTAVTSFLRYCRNHLLQP